MSHQSHVHAGCGTVRRIQSPAPWPNVLSNILEAANLASLQT